MADMHGYEMGKQGILRNRNYVSSMDGGLLSIPEAERCSMPVVTVPRVSGDS